MSETSVELLMTVFTAVILVMNSIHKPQQMCAQHIFQQMCHCEDRKQQLNTTTSAKKHPTAITSFMNKWQHRNGTWKCTKGGLCVQLAAASQSLVSSLKAGLVPWLCSPTMDDILIFYQILQSMQDNLHKQPLLLFIWGFYFKSLYTFLFQ